MTSGSFCARTPLSFFLFFFVGGGGGFNPSTWKAEAWGSEFEVSLVYSTNSRTAYTKDRLYKEPVSKQKTPTIFVRYTHLYLCGHAPTTIKCVEVNDLRKSVLSSTLWVPRIELGLSVLTARAFLHRVSLLALSCTQSAE